jgi:leucyl aminopeptidase
VPVPTAPSPSFAVPSFTAPRLPEVRLAPGPVTEVADADVLAVPLVTDPDGNLRLGSGGDDVAHELGIDLLRLAVRDKAKGEPGEVIAVPVLAEAVAVQQVLLTGVGDGSPSALRRAGAALGRKTRGRSSLATTVADAADDDGVRAFVEGLLLGSYSFTRKSNDQRPAPLAEAVLATSTDVSDALQRAVPVARATAMARDLTNTPSNEKSPDWLAQQAVRLGTEAGLSVVVRDEKTLVAEGWNGVVAVGMGSERPPRVVELSYTPSTVRGPHVVLIGKGITYDTGGLSLKPREAMVPMKTDMAGGAVVIVAMAALRDLDIGLRVTGVVPIADNAPSGSAQRPGDVIRHYGGRTVEVFNTDAEGRLVLADALAYADEQLAPDVVVDIATLTGAASIGLGRRHAALYATSEPLAGELLTASEATGERLWRMPLVDDYRFALDSSVADLANISRDQHVSGGSIIAALFLREFAGRRAWAHLDIAGPGRSEADEHEVSKGATGFGVRLLLRWLEALSTPPPPRG